MPYIPKDAEWYLADIVIQITVEDDPRNVVHTNLTLIRADSPQQAYEEALKLGEASQVSYANPDGKLVTSRFRGLRQLSVIHDQLDHGSEISYSEELDMSEEALVGGILAKDDLAVFNNRQYPKGLSYSSADIQEKLRQQFPHLFDSEGRRI